MFIHWLFHIYTESILAILALCPFPSSLFLPLRFFFPPLPYFLISLCVFVCAGVYVYICMYVFDCVCGMCVHVCMHVQIASGLSLRVLLVFLCILVFAYSLALRGGQTQVESPVCRQLVQPISKFYIQRETLSQNNMIRVIDEGTRCQLLSFKHTQTHTHHTTTHIYTHITHTTQTHHTYHISITSHATQTHIHTIHIHITHA